MNFLAKAKLAQLFDIFLQKEIEPIRSELKSRDNLDTLTIFRHFTLSSYINIDDLYEFCRFNNGTLTKLEAQLIIKNFSASEKLILDYPEFIRILFLFDLEDKLKIPRSEDGSQIQENAKNLDLSIKTDLIKIFDILPQTIRKENLLKRKILQYSQNNLRGLFASVSDRLDKKYITSKSLSNFMDVFNFSCTQTDIMNLISLIDKDKDERINFAEFSDIFIKVYEFEALNFFEIFNNQEITKNLIYSPLIFSPSREYTQSKQYRLLQFSSDQKKQTIYNIRNINQFENNRNLVASLINEKLTSLKSNIVESSNIEEYSKYSQYNLPLQIDEKVRRKLFRSKEKAKNLSSKELDNINEIDQINKNNLSNDATPNDKKDKTSEDIHYSNEGFEKASSSNISDKNKKEKIAVDQSMGNKDSEYEQNKNLNTPAKTFVQKEFSSTEASNSKTNTRMILKGIIKERCQMDANDINKLQRYRSKDISSKKYIEINENEISNNKLIYDLAKFMAFELSLNNYIEKCKEIFLPLINISIFKYFDINNQNYLTRNELERKLEDLNINFDSLDASLLFSFIDKNNDERIDQFEFYDFIVSGNPSIEFLFNSNTEDCSNLDWYKSKLLKEMIEGYLRKLRANNLRKKGLLSKPFYESTTAFKIIDHNDKGFFTPHDLKKLLLNIDDCFTDDEILYLYKEFDFSNCHKVTYGDYLRKMKIL